MLELGVNNVLGMLRADTPYAAGDPKIQAAPGCHDATLPRIEVQLTLASFWTRNSGGRIALLPRPLGTDLLMHDGRACDAVEPAFLHDGPAVRKLGMIDQLNAPGTAQLMQLRAFLYSL